VEEFDIEEPNGIEIPLCEDDWLCNKCNTMNKFDYRDRRSCYC
jgi:hypothetical protein